MTEETTTYLETRIETIYPTGSHLVTKFQRLLEEEYPLKTFNNGLAAMLHGIERKGVGSLVGQLSLILGTLHYPE